MEERQGSAAAAPAAGTGAQADPAEFSRGYRHYVLGVLLFVYAINILDRQILGILMEPIRLELDLNDTQLGFLSGIAFALFYATLGIPIARLADRTSRTGVIAICVAAWSAMTAVCGLAQNFWQLLAARIGVAVGEAGGSPPSHSLLADYFKEHERATALGIFSIGGPLGVMIGLFVGGWMNEWVGWRWTFVLVGLPGVLVALVVWLTVREPPKGVLDGQAPPEQSSVTEVFRFMWSQRAFRLMALGASLQAFVGYGLVQWYPVFFIRVHGMGTGELGTWLALIFGIGGGIGTFFGGYLADRLAHRTRRWYLWLPMIGTALGTPFYLGVFFSPTAAGAFLFLMIPAVLANCFLGPVFSSTQGLVPAHMRATAAAVLLFIINIIGLGLGPQIVGLLSDLLRPAFDVDSIRYALFLVSLVTLAGAALFWMAARTLEADLDRAAAYGKAGSTDQ
ncbi:MAG: MFS transporter [Gammaproteobacteria bacterium]|nr:MFS transporter [Gammaproteobacteria bacterium]